MTASKRKNCRKWYVPEKSYQIPEDNQVSTTFCAINVSIFVRDTKFRGSCSEVFLKRCPENLVVMRGKHLWRRFFVKSALLYACFSVNFTKLSELLFCGKSTAQKMKFSITDFSSKCNQIRSFMGIWSHLLKKFVMENFIFCAVVPKTYFWELSVNYDWIKLTL